MIVCPPVVEYSRAFQSRAAEELELLPEGSAIAQMLADYAVMRDQVRACSRQSLKENRDAALTEWRELSASGQHGLGNLDRFAFV